MLEMISDHMKEYSFLKSFTVVIPDGKDGLRGKEFCIHE